MAVNAVFGVVHFNGVVAACRAQVHVTSTHVPGFYAITYGVFYVAGKILLAGVIGINNTYL